MDSAVAATVGGILIVDDDLPFVAFLSTSFESVPDFRVVGFATDGNEAVLLADGISPDVIVSSYDVPDIGGRTLVQLLRVAAPAAAIIVYAEAWPAKDVEQARLAGADDCVDKTMPTPELARRLRATRRARQQGVSV